jgi:hypothetical protein
MSNTSPDPAHPRAGEDSLAHRARPSRRALASLELPPREEPQVGGVFVHEVGEISEMPTPQDRFAFRLAREVLRIPPTSAIPLERMIIDGHTSRSRTFPARLALVERLAWVAWKSNERMPSRHALLAIAALLADEQLRRALGVVAEVPSHVDEAVRRAFEGACEGSHAKCEALESLVLRSYEVRLTPARRRVLERLIEAKRRGDEAGVVVPRTAWAALREQLGPDVDDLVSGEGEGPKDERGRTKSNRLKLKVAPGQVTFGTPAGRERTAPRRRRWTRS